MRTVSRTVCRGLIGTTRRLTALGLPLVLAGLGGCSRATTAPPTRTVVPVADAEGGTDSKAGPPKTAGSDAAKMTAEDSPDVPATSAAAAGATGPGSVGARATADAGRPDEATPSGLVPGSLVLARRLRLAAPISDDRIKMIKLSNDKIYVFFYDAGLREVVEGIESGEDYDVTFKVKEPCPGETDFCGALLRVEEH